MKNYKIQSNLTTKLSLKKIVFLKIVLKIKPTNFTMSNFHKNTFLRSPFHFKTVKAHISAPTIVYKTSSPTILLFSGRILSAHRMCKFKLTI